MSSFSSQKMALWPEGQQYGLDSQVPRKDLSGLGPGCRFCSSL
jgi:hypothetical protein